MLQSKQIIEKDTTIYVITHGRPNPKDRPTTWWLEEAGLPFKFVMNEKQVDSYLSAGVSENQIVSVSDEWEDEYFEKHKTYPVPFHGAICNRQMCLEDAKKNGKKYAYQLDDNIVIFGAGKIHTTGKTKEYYARNILPKVFEHLYRMCECTNIGYMGIVLGATPTVEKKILRNGYAYSCFIENVEADIKWRGPFDDDVLHNLDFNHSGTYTNAVLSAYHYTKESKSNTGMRAAYDKWGHIRPIATSQIYPDHVQCGLATKANGQHMRFYHKLKPPHRNVRIKDEAAFKELIHEIRETQLKWIKYNKEVRNSG